MRARFFAFSVVCVSVVFTAFLSRYVVTHSHFVGDDYCGFWLAHSRALGEYLLDPIGAHIVPLHRAVTYLVYKTAPMDFVFALRVLLVFHILSVLLLYHTLQVLKNSPINIALIFLYSVHETLGYLFIWWSSGLHRLPYILFAITSCYFYLRFRSSRNPVFFGAVVLSFLLAVGFYTKAILIPLYLVGIEICLSGSIAHRRFLRNFRWLSILLLLSILYLFTWSYLSIDTTKTVNLELSYHLNFQAKSWATLACSMFALVWPFVSVEQGAAVGLLWFSFIAYTVVRRRSTALIWTVLAVVVGANFLLLSLSVWSLAFGEILPLIRRYYYEVVFLVVIFLGLILHRVSAPSEVIRDARREPRRLAAGVVVVGLGIAISVASYSSFTEIVSTYYQRHMILLRFVKNLASDFEAIEKEDDDPTLVDGRLPVRLMCWNSQT